MRPKHNFRSIIATEQFRAFNNLWDSVLVESENFVALPSLGQLVSGWLLVAPRKWHLCSAAFSPHLFSELHGFLNQVADLIEKAFGPVAIFEHGPSATDTPIGCGVDHAHIHLVPKKQDWWLLRTAKSWYPEIEWAEVSSIEETSEYYFDNKPYLFLRESIETRPVIGTGRSIPSQLFRRIIASYVGRPHDYDWRVFPEFMNISSTIACIKELSE